MTPITIAGYTFTVPSPFAEGHVCTAAEAEVLNRAMHANLRRNFAREVGPAQCHETLQELQSRLDALALAYRFGGPDPSEAEALVIAEQIIRAKLKARRLALGDYSRAQITEQAKALLASTQGGEIRLMARDRVAQLQRAARAELARAEGQDNG
jgi:hypothetical protein